MVSCIVHPAQVKLLQSPVCMLLWPLNMATVCGQYKSKRHMHIIYEMTIHIRYAIDQMPLFLLMSFQL